MIFSWCTQGSAEEGKGKGKGEDKERVDIPDEGSLQAMVQNAMKSVRESPA